MAKDWHFIGLVTQADYDESKDPYLFRVPSLTTGQMMEETVILPGVKFLIQ